MIKVVVFLESDIARIEPELNRILSGFDILHVWNTNNRLVFILKEKAQRGRPVKKDEQSEG